jgi:hypothetical protein
MSEKIDHPPHYNNHPSGLEAIDIAEQLGFNLGNAWKYICRAGKKDVPAAEDYAKAAWYCKRAAPSLDDGYFDPREDADTLDDIHRWIAAEPDPGKKAAAVGLTHVIISEPAAAVLMCFALASFLEKLSAAFQQGLTGAAAAQAAAEAALPIERVRQDLLVEKVPGAR